MSFNEIRGSFIDEARTRANLRLLVMEVDRIRALAQELNISAHRWQATNSVLSLGRFDASIIRTLLPLVFELLQDKPDVARELNLLRQECDEADRGQDGIAAADGEVPFAMRQQMLHGYFLKEHAPRVAIRAERLVCDLESVLRSLGG